MADNSGIFCAVFVFIEKFFCTGKRNLIDVFFNFIRCHPDSLVDNVDFLVFFIDFYFNFWISVIYFGFPDIG